MMQPSYAAKNLSSVLAAKPKSTRRVYLASLLLYANHSVARCSRFSP